MQTFKPMTDLERLKYEAAQRLGLMEKLKQVGWAGLTGEESGRIGGLVSAMRRRS